MKINKQMLALLLALLPILMHAQLTVNSSGKVIIGNNQYSPTADLTVGNINSLYGLKNAIVTGISASSENCNIGISSLVNPSLHSQYGINIGVLGSAGGALFGGNFGIYGTLYNASNGAGVLGSIGYLQTSVVGQYAGLFDGQVLATGEIRASSFVTTSDARLKNNIKPFALEGSALEKVLDMDVVSYNYKERKIEKEQDNTENSALREFNQKQAEICHYGLLAQELQKIYPNLVYEGQDGYLGINYVELVPVLIRSIQELKQELDEFRVYNDNGTIKLSRNAATSVASTIATGNKLYQNTPNPFKEKTIIRFSLADDAQNANICIYDMSGKQLRKLPISSGDSSVSINGWELGEGMFLYSLIVNGQEIDTKKMVITK